MTRLMQIMLTAVAVVVAGVSQLTAGQITTTFASDNSFEGNMFDVTTAGNALTVTGLDVNVDAAGSFDIDVYLKSGTYVGSETTPGDWTLVATGTGTGAGINTPSFVDITDFLLPASSLLGMYVTISPAVGFGSPIFMLYTNGNNTYSNADLQLDLGIGVGGLFGVDGGIFDPRIWNGTIYYDVHIAAVPEPGALTLAGMGAVGLVAAAIRRRRQPAA